MKILFLMILLHIIDDFVFQPQSLSYLKQKSWWEKNAPDEMYKGDYIMALFLHGLSWSIMIHLPIMFTEIVPIGWFSLSIIGNAAFHAAIDDAKANKKYLNLVQDQITHLAQIVIVFILFALQ